MGGGQPGLGDRLHGRPKKPVWASRRMRVMSDQGEAFCVLKSLIEPCSSFDYERWLGQISPKA